MRRIDVNAAGTQYPIYIGRGLLGRGEEYLAPYAGRQAMLVCDENTSRLYGEATEQLFARAGICTRRVVLPAGEETKSMTQLQRLYDAFLDAELTRADVVVALGGGVIGDLAGYAAASYMRGVHFVQIPTTLLAQVDSSVGGKVAINHPRGKNLIGAFYQPELVLIDTDTLRTLDARQLGAGLGEVIKYGCILDEALFAQLEACQGRKALWDRMDEVIARCCALKADIVAQDPEDRGIRMILNYGHTLAHAIENVMGYGQVLHGEAVGIGLVEAARWGEHLGVTPQGTHERLARVEEALGVVCTFPRAERARLAAAMGHDKKASGKTINLILLRRIGEAMMYPIALDELSALMQKSI